MTASQDPKDSIIKQLTTAIEELNNTIVKLQQEISQLKYELEHSRNQVQIQQEVIAKQQEQFDAKTLEHASQAQFLLDQISNLSQQVSTLTEKASAANITAFDPKALNKDIQQKVKQVKQEANKIGSPFWRSTNRSEQSVKKSASTKIDPKDSPEGNSESSESIDLKNKC
jgi:chromosome segregation ATPase